MKEKEKILIVIPGDLYVRNYILTNVFSELEQLYECDFIASEEITIRASLESKSSFRGYYIVDSKMKALHQRIFNLMMWRYRNRSTSFLFRSNRTAPDFKRSIKAPYYRAPFRLLKWMILKPFINLRRKLIDIDFLYKKYEKYLKKKVKTNGKLRSFITSKKYSLVLLPASGYSVEGIDIAILCEELRMKSLFLVDNWDNLSSKTIIWKKPSHIGVWGEQSRQHAQEIQNFSDDSISILGTPRFDNYFSLRDSSLESHFTEDYILFVGTALNFDEESVLEEIDNIIDNNKDLWGNLKLVYRPHPWRQNSIQVKKTYGNHIITDPQILENSKDKSTRTQPNLDYYPSLIQNSKFVIGGLTSMLIESLIFHKQFLALVHKDESLVTNMRNTWKSFEHFRGLTKVEGVSFSLSKNDLEQEMINCWKNKESINTEKIDIDRDWYLHEDGFGYKSRLLSCVKNLIEATL